MNLLDPGFLKFGFRRWVTQLRQARAHYDVVRKNPTLRLEEDVQILSPDRLFLGEDVLIMKGAILDCGGLEWCDYRGRITLGDRCAIGSYSVLIGAGEIIMENDSGLAFGVHLIAQEGRLLADGMTTKSQNCQLDFQPIIMREGSWATSGAIILAGSEIGKKSVIGPGAVVKGKVPPNSMVIGNPGRILPLRQSEDGAYRPW